MSSSENGNFKLHGTPPFSMIVLHGGPGAAGSAGSLSASLSRFGGVIEPFQCGRSITDQLSELYDLINNQAHYPVVLIGHSWGAWLAFLFTANYPAHVEKLVMISSPPFTNDYLTALAKAREERINKEEGEILKKLGSDKDALIPENFKKIAQIYSRVDSFDLLPIDDNVDFRPDLYHSIWNEAAEMRLKGELISVAHKISCPVFALHSDFDPHPWKGVLVPLEDIIADFKFFLLGKCGHYPWKERLAKNKFFEIMVEILSSERL